MKLLNKTTDATTLNGIPHGMTSEVVNWFKNKGIRVILSIGGITYTNDWNTALKQNATQLGMNAAAVAEDLGVGIEIDYEENSSPNLEGLQHLLLPTGRCILTMQPEPTMLQGSPSTLPRAIAG